MTRFYLRAAYAAVLMASMSFAGHAADFSSKDQINVDDFWENGVIYGDNVNINASSGPAVSLTGSSSALETYSLQSSPGGKINIVGSNGGVLVTNQKPLSIGADNTASVKIDSSGSGSNVGDVSATLATKNDGSSLIVSGKTISISGEGENFVTGVQSGGLNTSSGTVLKLGNGYTDSITINVKATGEFGSSYGVMAYDGSEIALDAKNIEVSVNTNALHVLSGTVDVGSDNTKTLMLRGGSSGVHMARDVNFFYEDLARPTVALKGEVIKVYGESQAINNSEGILTVGLNNTKSILLAGTKGYAIRSVADSETTINAQKITLIGGNAIGGSAVYNDASTVTVGSDDTQSVVIKATAFPDPDEQKVGAGLSTKSQGTTTVKGKEILIQSLDTGVYAEEGTTIVSATDKLDISGTQLGVRVQNNDENGEGNRASITLSAENISVKSSSVGISATSRGLLDVNGNLEINAPTAIEARGNSTINVNTDASKGYKTVINGDVVYAVGSGTGEVLDAQVNLNLSGEDSRWTGNVVTVTPETVSPDDDNKTVKSMHLSLSDGAQWNVTGSDLSAEDGSKAAYANINTLALNAGVINMDAEDAPESVSIDKLEGTGGTINARAVRGTDGSLTTSNVTVGEVAEGSSVAMVVNYKGITSDALTAENTKDLKALDIASGTASVSEYVEEGDINGAWTRQDGEGGGNFQANTKLTNFSSVNAMSLVQWRNEINHLTKRLGDIRVSEDTIGAWARVYGGESQWGGANEVEMDHTTIQVGGDYRINNHWVAGAAFSYTDSRADLSNGDADGDSYSLAIYGTYTADGGSFLDLIGRYGYLKNDITAGNMALDTSSSAFSLSAEMGHTFRFINDAAYVEPQIEFTYGFIGGDAATATNNVRIEQDDFQSFVTRVGVRAGYDFPQKKGSVYGMFSYSYDWMGDADGTASKDGLRQALSQDLGGGWVTYGVGAQIMLGDSAYFYGELERTSGGDIDNPYLFSAGVRMTF